MEDVRISEETPWTENLIILRKFQYFVQVLLAQVLYMVCVVSYMLDSVSVERWF